MSVIVAGVIASEGGSLLAAHARGDALADHRAGEMGFCTTVAGHQGCVGDAQAGNALHGTVGVGGAARVLEVIMHPSVLASYPSQPL